MLKMRKHKILRYFEPPSRILDIEFGLNNKTPKRIFFSTKKEEGDSLIELETKSITLIDL